MKRECSLIRDLLPLYVEQMVSEESKKIIEEHLAQCPSCKKVYEEMTERELGMRPEMGENDESEAAESFRRICEKGEAEGADENRGQCSAFVWAGDFPGLRDSCWHPWGDHTAPLDNPYFRGYQRL